MHQRTSIPQANMKPGAGQTGTTGLCGRSSYAFADQGILELQQAIGNRAARAIVDLGFVQAKPRSGSVDKSFERQADLILRMPATDEDRNGEASSDTVENDPPSPGPNPGGLIVDDNTAELAPGQMRKSAFLAEVRSAVCHAAEEAFAETDHTAQGCPWIEATLRFYEGRGAERIEHDLAGHVPDASGVSSARDYIPFLAARTRRSVETWAETGEVTGLPEGLPGIGLAGALFSGMAGLFFKAKPGGPQGPSHPHSVQEQLGDGRPLAGAVRSRMESVFGKSFSNVRIHNDAGAARLSDGFRARAFTVGNHIAFGSGEYRPGSPVGDALVAHELAHVVQQKSGAASGPMPDRASRYHHLEADADRSAIAAMMSLWSGGRQRRKGIGRAREPRLRAGLSLQRCARTQPVTASEADLFIQGQFGENVAATIARGISAASSEINIVDDAEFRREFEANNAYIRSLGGTPRGDDSTGVHAFVDQRPHPRPRVWVHRERQQTTTILHEALHIYAHPDYKRQFPWWRPDEGFTEYFTRRIAEEQSLATSRPYEEPYQEVRALVGVSGEGPLRAAYFQGNVRGLESAIDGSRGDGTFGEWLVEMILGNYRRVREIIRRGTGSDRTAVQPKLKVGSSDDPLEKEADRVAEAATRVPITESGPLVPRPQTSLRVQRKCSRCAENEEDELVQPKASASSPAERSFFEPRFGHELTDIRAPLLTKCRNTFIQRKAIDSPAGSQAQGSTGHESRSAASPTAEAPADLASREAGRKGLIVDDETPELGPEQMRKSAFLAEVRGAVCSSADEAFAGTEHTTQGCPWIEATLRFYEGRSAERIERDMAGYVPESASATTARDYIPFIAERARRSVETWVETGEVTGLPEGLPGMGLAGALGGSPVSGLFFKAKPGGPRGGAHPQVVQAQLGRGRPLESSVRSRMESAFGHRFSDVRVHADSGAARLSNHFDARAFTLGEHVAFGAGEYRPGSPAGEALLAHELTHVVQQRGNAGSTGDTHRAEQEAESATVSFLSYLSNSNPSRFDVDLRTGLRLQRCPRNRQRTTPGQVAQVCPDVARVNAGSDWNTLVTAATSSRACGALREAERLYRLAILRAVQAVQPPQGVPARVPVDADIQIDFNITGSLAVTQSSQVPNHPNNYWRWIFFGPDTLLDTQAHTESVIFHELTHVRQFIQIWNSYNALPPAQRGTWEAYRRPFSRRDRVLGPEELEAEITVLRYLHRLTEREQRQGLEGVFVAYVRTSVYTPPPGEALAITPAQARNQILAAFQTASGNVKDLMGYYLWRSLIRINPPAASWQRILQDLEPVARRGYADATFRPHYDTFLRRQGLRAADIWRGGP